MVIAQTRQQSVFDPRVDIFTAGHVGHMTSAEVTVRFTVEAATVQVWQSICKYDHFIKVCVNLCNNLLKFGDYEEDSQRLPC